MLMISLFWLSLSGCADTAGNVACESHTERLEALATGEASIPAGQITETGEYDAKQFILSGKTAEASAIATANGAANPAQSTISKREYCSHRNSLADVIAEHGSSEVVKCRFGLSASKHITHHRHSLLLRICVLTI